ncbi:MAG TPA: polysaccharide biosynthesis protein, partial [Flavobacteriaceae bacterium]|nr:polysaccharide biosynthesis protein [Flavobacteriaceae bacterium]
FLVLLIINIIVLAIVSEKIFLTSALVVYSFFSFTFLFSFRLAVKQFYEYFKIYQTEVTSENAVIVGIDENAISVAAALDIEHPQRFKIKGFISAHSSNKRLLILGKPVVKIKDKLSD